MMKKVLIRNYTKEDGHQVVQLQNKYTEQFPDAPVLSANVYNSPGFANGQNIFCAFDEDGRLLAYAPLFPRLVDPEQGPEYPNHIWIVIKVDPEVEDPEPIKDLLYERVLARAAEIKEVQPERRMRLGVNYFASESRGIDYFLAKNFTLYERVYGMRRDLSQAIPDLKKPVGVEIRKCDLKTQEEREQYLRAENQAFPHAPTSMESLEHFLQGPFWKKGKAISAFDENDQVVGSVMTYWNEETNQKSQRKVGATEDIFVLPDWRGQGLAKYLIREGFLYMQEHGLEEAHLRVVCANEGALTLYKKMGYQVYKEEVMLEMWI